MRQLVQRSCSTTSAGWYPDGLMRSGASRMIFCGQKWTHSSQALHLSSAKTTLFSVSTASLDLLPRQNKVPPQGEYFPAQHLLHGRGNVL